MALDGSEHEPEEPDPEADLRDPESDSLTIPRVDTEDAGSGLRADLEAELEAETVETPEVPSTDAEVPGELAKAFWALVIVVNGAVLGISLGVLLLVFEGDTERGGALLAGGVLLFGFAIRRYRAFRTSASASDDGTDDADDQTDEGESDDRPDVGESDEGEPNEESSG